MAKKINGYAKWILIAVAVLTILYNTVVTHVTAKNDIKHIQQDITEIKQNIDKINERLWENRPVSNKAIKL